MTVGRSRHTLSLSPGRKYLLVPEFVEVLPRALCCPVMNTASPWFTWFRLRWVLVLKHEQRGSMKLLHPLHHRCLIPLANTLQISTHQWVTRRLEAFYPSEYFWQACDETDFGVLMASQWEILQERNKSPGFGGTHKKDVRPDLIMSLTTLNCCKNFRILLLFGRSAQALMISLVWWADTGTAYM